MNLTNVRSITNNSWLYFLNLHINHKEKIGLLNILKIYIYNIKNKTHIIMFECHLCKKGTYTDSKSSKNCTLCPKDTYSSGIDGVVCSAYESFDIKTCTTNDFITLCPGIRPFGEDVGDQKRVADIPYAKENKVDFIVVGRPIYKASNPKEVVEKILSHL